VVCGTVDPCDFIADIQSDSQGTCVEPYAGSWVEDAFRVVPISELDHCDGWRGSDHGLNLSFCLVLIHPTFDEREEVPPGVWTFSPAFACKMPSFDVFTAIPFCC
jgi:hypothetical protein